MKKIALICSEPLRVRMAGIGIRYLELARRLPAFNFETVLIHPGEAQEIESGCEVRIGRPGHLHKLLFDCDVAVCQGQLGNSLVTESPDIPTVVDLYDPWLVENLHYSSVLGLAPFRNDHASWILQMSRGDFFICSSEEQRQYYLGWLSALGRVNPFRIQQDPDLTGLIAPVPFGIPMELPDYRPYLPAAANGGKRILFGGLYDWYDPFSLLNALEHLDRPEWSVLFIKSPNPDTTPQQLMADVTAWARERGWLGQRVQILEWVPADRRYDLLRDVDVMATPHRLSLETRLSLRTRYLDALAAGCPVISTEGGAISRLLRQYGAGQVVPPGDPIALADSLSDTLCNPPGAGVDPEGVAALKRMFCWENCLAPLVSFCRSPRIDATKEDFAFRPTSRVPQGALWGILQRVLKSRSLKGGRS